MNTTKVNTNNVQQTDVTENSRLIQIFRSLSLYLTLVSLIFPLFGVTGWILEIPLMAQVFPSLPAMQPNTALGLVLGAIAILLFRNEAPSSKRFFVAFVFATIVLLFGLIVLSEYIFGWNLQIDQIFIPIGDTVDQPFPGRPAPQTALNFFLLGLGLLSLNLRFLSVYVGQMSALLIGGNALIAATGYIFNTAQFYGFPIYVTAIGMAIPTSIGFIILAAALLCLRPTEGIMALISSNTRSGNMARRILLACILAPPLIGTLTRIGVIAKWYDVSVQISLFAVIIVGLILRTTWQAAKQSEFEEIRANQALKAVHLTNENLKRIADERKIFKTFIENSSDFIGLADANGKPTYINPAGRRMVGMAPDFPIENTQITEYYTPDQRSFAKDVIVKSMLENGFWKGETSFRNWQTDNAIPVSDEHFIIKDLETGRTLGMGTVTRDISDIKKEQEKIRESEERFKLALKGADLGAWDWNIKTGKVIFNPRWAEMRGFKSEEIKPHVDSWTAGIHPDDLSYVQNKLSEYLHGHIHEYQVEFRTLTKSGNWIWVFDRGKIFERDEQGNPSRMVGTELDITKRKRTEMELQASELRFRGIVESAYDSILIVDTDGRIVLINAQLGKKFNYSSEELIGQPVEILIPERYREKHITQRSNYTKDAHPRVMGAGFELYGRKKDGSEFPVDISLSPNSTPEGLRVTAIIRDVTESKKLENQQTFLSETTRIINETLNYQERLQLMTDAIVPKIADLCVVALLENEALQFKAAAIRDRSKSELLKQFAPSGLTSRGPYGAYAAITSKKPFLIENISEKLTSINLTDPSWLAYIQKFGITSFVTLPLLVSDKIIGTISLAMTDSNRKFSPSDLSFAEIIANRCAIGVNNALLYLKAKQAVQARENILAIVSHDLKNPVASIDMSAELLLKHEFSEQNVHTLAQRIKKSSSLIQRLISDLLDFGKLEAGVFSVEKKPVNVQSIIDTALESLSGKVLEKEMQLDIKIPPNIPDIFGDKDRIVQVLWNLVGNAIKFTPKKGNISVNVDTEPGYVKFTITDNGPGIESKDLPKVFDQFWQAKKTATLGTGLGLSIAKGIIEAHNGKIWVESEFGHGCKFYFTVPTTKKASVSSDQKLKSDEKSILGDQPLMGIYLLIVDDNVDNLYLTRHFLEKAGAKVSEAPSVAEALTKIAQDRPDVVITDIEMPDEDGYDLIKKIHQLNNENFYLPVVALTGHEDKEELKKITEAGFDTQLSKPITMKKLTVAIQTVLNSAHFTKRHADLDI